MASMMKIAALLLLGMVLVASAAEVAEEQARPSINAEQVMAGRYKMDAAAMMMHQRRLQTFFGGRLFGFGNYGYPYGGGYFGGYPGNFGGASASAAASSTPFSSSASAAASSGGFNGYNGGFPYGGGFGGFNGGFFG